MQNRWYSLLYDEPISRIAVAAMRNLHPEVVESVHSKALYTTQEEDLLGTIKSVRTHTHTNLLNILFSICFNWWNCVFIFRRMRQP